MRIRHEDRIFAWHGVSYQKLGVWGGLEVCRGGQQMATRAGFQGVALSRVQNCFAAFSAVLIIRKRIKLNETP